MEITLELVERLRQKANVSYLQAKTALEHTDGNLLDALIWLEQQGQAEAPREGGQYTTQAERGCDPTLSQVIAAGQQQEESADLWSKLKDLARRGMENELQIIRSGAVIGSIPVLIAAVLLLVSFGLALVLLAVGFVCGCRYRFSGPDLDRKEVNQVMDTVNNTVDGVRRQVMDEMRSHHEKHADKKRNSR